MAEERDDPLDRLLHAVELPEGRVGPDRPVHEDPAEARSLGGVHEFGLADRREDALCGRGVHQGLVATGLQVLGERHLRVAAGLVPSGEALEKCAQPREVTSDTAIVIVGIWERRGGACECLKRVSSNVPQREHGLRKPPGVEN